MARKRCDNTTAAAIEVGDLIEPNNNGFRATVIRKEDNPSRNIVEPHVALHWTYPSDDFSVNANFRGTTSGRYFRPEDPITRWVDSGRAAVGSPGKLLADPAPKPAPDLPEVTVDLADLAEDAWGNAQTSTRQDVVRSLNSRFNKGGSDALRRRQRYLLGKGPWCTQRDLAELHMLPEALKRAADRQRKAAIPADTAAVGADYRQAVTRLIAAADVVTEYRADLSAFADTLAGKRWGSEVTGPIKDMDSQLVGLEGDYRDLAAQMNNQGAQGAAAYEQAPWVPDDESVLA